jgi:hypothetical protein
MPMHELCELEIDGAANSRARAFFLASAQPSVMGTHPSGATFINQGGAKQIQGWR